MGALPGGRVLTGRASADLFDVERYRASTERLAVVRAPRGAALVLGSTQPESVVERGRAEEAGVAVVRRRSGGGAVLLAPGDPLWFDLWVPRGDPLWDDDVVVAARWVGEWWASALRDAGTGELAVHAGPSGPAPWARLVCFAGIGPGEVTAGGRKVVGVAQWRCRQGALFHACAYRHFDPAPLVDLLAADAVGDARELAGYLGRAAVGMDELITEPPDPADLLHRLPVGPPWRTGA